MPKVGSKRQITLPADQCRLAGIAPGDEYESFVSNEGHITIIKKAPGAAREILHKTLTHRKCDGQPLTPEETGRQVRLAKVLALAKEVFGDEAKAKTWLQKPKKLFDGRSAMDLITTEEGALLVEQALRGIDPGFLA